MKPCVGDADRLWKRYNGKKFTGTQNGLFLLGFTREQEKNQKIVGDSQFFEEQTWLHDYFFTSGRKKLAETSKEMSLHYYLRPRDEE